MWKNVSDMVETEELQKKDEVSDLLWLDIIIIWQEHTSHAGCSPNLSFPQVSHRTVSQCNAK